MRFIPSTTADLAAWVQAIGTILAIAAAAGIAFWQHWRERRRELDGQLHQQQQIAKLCIVFGGHLSHCVAKLWQGCEFQNKEIVSRQASRLRDIVAFARAIDVSSIPSEAVHSFMDLRSLAAEALATAEHVENTFITWSHWTGLFERLLKNARSSIVELHAAFGERITVEELEKQADSIFPLGS